MICRRKEKLLVCHLVCRGRVIQALRSFFAGGKAVALRTESVKKHQMRSVLCAVKLGTGRPVRESPSYTAGGQSLGERLVKTTAQESAE